MGQEYRIPDAVKDPAESMKVEIDFYDACVVEWRPNEPYVATEYVRPTIPNGFAYECTTGGLSGTKEPRWPTTVGVTIASGGAVFTCRAAGSNGLNPISGPSATPDPAGLTISGVSVSESHKILATYAGGTDGQDYDAVYNFTLDGVARVARQRVRISKR